MNDPLCHPTIRHSKVWMLQGGGVTGWELPSRKLGDKCGDEPLSNPPPRSFSGESYLPKEPQDLLLWFFQLQKLMLQEVRESYGPQTSLLFFYHVAFYATMAELNEL